MSLLQYKNEKQNIKVRQLKFLAMDISASFKIRVPLISKYLKLVNWDNSIEQPVRFLMHYFNSPVAIFRLLENFGNGQFRQFYDESFTDYKIPEIDQLREFHWTLQVFLMHHFTSPAAIFRVLENFKLSDTKCLLLRSLTTSSVSAI